ncbi:MAG TPA: hypothetical protein VF595_12320 [Tepidisphaeraceae bacterium]|jgi:hypothetical protein
MRTPDRIATFQGATGPKIEETLIIEAWESRRLYDGTVTVATTGETILVSGDGAANEILLKVNTTPDGDDGVPGIVVDTDTALVIDGKRVRGGSYAFSTTPLESIKNFTVDFGSGNDFLRVSSDNLNRARSIFNGLDINGGNGNDRVELLCSTTALRYLGGRGIDSLGIASGITVYGNAEIRPGDGRDRITIGNPAENSDVSVRGKLLVVDTNGPLALAASTSTAA